MRILLFLFAIVTTSFCVKAQDNIAMQNIDHGSDIMLQLDSLELVYNIQPKVSYELGTSAFTNFDGFYGFNTYVSPHMVFQPSKKWIVDGGVYLGRTQAFNVPYYNNTSADQTIIDMGVYARGTYLVNDKLYVGGAGYMNYANVETSLPNDRRNAYNNITGETFVGYKFSDSFRVEAGFSISNYNTNNPTFMNQRNF